MFWDKFLILCNKKNVTPTNAALELGYSRGVITRWKNGSIPNDANLLQIANYFGVPIDYFSEGKEYIVNGNYNAVGNQNSVIVSETSDANEYELLKSFRRLNIVNKAKVIIYTFDLEKEQKNNAEN